MKKQDKIVKLYTGDEILISRLKQELEVAGINPMIKDGFKQGLAAGYGEGVPSAIDLFVVESELQKAQEILKAITEE
ncbi:putative signal transducing protein [Draconibacterium halophilum]|uniref:DUF2007 domain-containing protein n=1 Tax=Draconibacterium halophilum TaxID=2706887 RepID=A0A6C0REX0_9BACT|nr:DUF2007 domain-containing protein [Draconibacterium halophilum]QIA09258.1 DUF2007 domain-containing protein [Draconibacterium halophilum]